MDAAYDFLHSNLPKGENTHRMKSSYIFPPTWPPCSFLQYTAQIVALSDSVVEYEMNPIGTAIEHVYGLAENHPDAIFRQKVAKAIRTVEECFQKYK